MKKGLNPIIGLITLLIGLSFVGLSVLWTPLPRIAKLDDSAPKEINPCSLKSGSEAFLNKDVIVQATLYRIDNHILVYPNLDCGLTDPRRGYLSTTFDPGIWTELDLNDYSGPFSFQPELFLKNGVMMEIDAEIRGVLFRQAPSEDGSTYKLKPTNIKVAGQWRRFTVKGAA